MLADFMVVAAVLFHPVRQVSHSFFLEIIMVAYFIVAAAMLYGLVRQVYNSLEPW